VRRAPLMKMVRVGRYPDPLSQEVLAFNWDLHMEKLSYMDVDRQGVWKRLSRLQIELARLAFGPDPMPKFEVICELLHPLSVLVCFGANGSLPAATKSSHSNVADSNDERYAKVRAAQADFKST
jgi:hypothetical protein